MGLPAFDEDFNVDHPAEYRDDLFVGDTIVEYDEVSDYDRFAQSEVYDAGTKCVYCGCEVSTDSPSWMCPECGERNDQS